MVMSIPILASASNLFGGAVLIDMLDIYDVGPSETVGFETVRPLTLARANVPGIVQTTSLANAIESRTEQVYSIKVARETEIAAGQAVTVTRCVQEPELVGKTLYVDKVSLNGAALLRKAVASDFEQVDQQGKGGL